MDLLMGLGRSVGLLAVVSIAYTYVIRHLPAGRPERTLALGLLFAAGAGTAMLTPTILVPGIFIDARSVLLGLAALFGGPVAALVAGTLTGAFRLWQGGAGALAGLAGIVASTLTGVAFERALRHRGARLGTPELLLLGAVVGPMNLVGVVLLPSWALIGQVMTTAAPALLATSLFGILFLGTLMLRERDRLAVKTALADSERRFQEITSVLTEGVYMVNGQDVIEYVNPAAEEMLGWRRGELLGCKAHETFHHTHRDGSPFPAAECSVHQAIATGRRFTAFEDHFVRKDGSWLPVALAAAPLVRDGHVYGAVAAFHEISERLRQQQILRESEERYRLLFNSSLDAVFVYHLRPDGTPTAFVDVNDVACERLGYTREELLARTPADICDAEGVGEIPRIVDEIRRDGFGVFERVHVAADGRRIPVETSARLFQHKGNSAVIAISRDITERKRAEERIHRLAHYDALTDLPNRRLLMDRLERAVALAARHGRDVAVLMLDLDGFKPVNDTYGHDVGDELLVAIARRLEASVRRADTIARLGGDEFVIVLSEVGAVPDAEMVADKVIAVINEPVELAGTAIHVGASIGIAVFPTDGRDPAALMKAADQAMYRAKANGRNQYAVRALA